jgi:membrane-bound ClpP family serine protease
MTMYRGNLIWPVLLIAIGVMFLLEEFMPRWGVGKTWPILLIVIGILKLLDINRPPRPPEGPRLS